MSLRCSDHIGSAINIDTAKFFPFSEHSHACSAVHDCVTPAYGTRDSSAIANIGLYMLRMATALKCGNAPLQADNIVTPPNKITRN
jgi:hypothetical protein